MNNKYVLTLFLLIFSGATVFAAQEVQEKPLRAANESHREVQRFFARDTKGLPPEIEWNYTKMTISATLDFPEPLLKYRLYVYPNEKESGNAAFLYADAFSEYTRIRNDSLDDLYRTSEYRQLDPKIDWKKIESLKFKAFPIYSTSNEEFQVSITAEEEEWFYSKMRLVYEILEKASRRSYYDWSDTYQFEGYATLMVHLDKSRQLGRFLAGKADWEIRNGKYEDAIRTLRVGFALGRNTLDNNPQCGLIGFYVGNGILRTMYDQVEHLSVQPDAPNLYPALTQICNSGDTIINAMNMEKYFLFSRPVAWDVFDTINEASAKESQAVFEELVKSLFEMSSHVQDRYIDSVLSLLYTFTSISVYPWAKERLLAKGLTEEEIENMSTAQIAAPYFLEEIKRDYDDILVVSMFPRGESHTAITFDESRYPKGHYRNALDLFRAVYLPTPMGAQNSYLFLRQKQDHLMIVNALRYYAAKHDGTLPDSLEDIKEVPVPKIDPCSGKPYQYRRDGKTAIIDYTTYGLSRLEITIE